MVSEENVKLIRERVSHVCEKLGIAESVLKTQLPHLDHPQLFVPPAVADDIDVAKFIDHTILKPTSTPDQVRAIVDEAKKYHFASVCVNGNYAPLIIPALEGTGVSSCFVVGFPLGAMAPESKAAEARALVEMGAKEIDMVIQIGWVQAEDYEAALKDIRLVAEACHNGPKKALLKVILECGAGTVTNTIDGTILSVLAGADYVKTSTGFGYSGARAEDVAVMRAIVGDKLGVKASGGIHSYEEALTMLRAGATRLGCSAGVKIVTRS